MSTRSAFVPISIEILTTLPHRRLHRRLRLRVPTILAVLSTVVSYIQIAKRQVLFAVVTFAASEFDKHIEILKRRAGPRQQPKKHTN